MTMAVEHKRHLEKMTGAGGDCEQDREAAKWALAEIEFLQGKVKEIRALLAAAEERTA